MKKINIFLIALVGLMLISCESATTQDLSAVVTTPTYTTNIEAVFSANCVGCHSGSGQFPDLNSYATVKNATLNGNVICRIKGTCGGIMPQSGSLPQATISMVELWATNNCPQ